MSYSALPFETIEAALAVPCPNESVITPKKVPLGSIGGSKVPLIAFRSLSKVVVVFTITP